MIITHQICCGPGVRKLKDVLLCSDLNDTRETVHIYRKICDKLTVMESTDSKAWSNESRPSLSEDMSECWGFSMICPAFWQWPEG